MAFGYQLISRKFGCIGHLVSMQVLKVWNAEYGIERQKAKRQEGGGEIETNVRSRKIPVALACGIHA